MDHRFVGLGPDGAAAYLYRADRKTKARQVLWGDYLRIDADMGDGWLRVIWAPNDPAKRQELFVREADTAFTRPLEIVFVDVGQGDGAVLITPERDRSERVVVIDAGERQNMGQFLNERFKAYETGFGFHAAVITHPDRDHYMGFKPIFESERIGFDVVYHSGLVERPVAGTWEKLGGRTDPDPVTKRRYITALARDDAAIRDAFGDAGAMGGYSFPQVMHAAVTNPRIGSFAMLSTEDGDQVDGRTYLPGFSPHDDQPEGYTVEVLSPVVETGPDGSPALRLLGSYGETKNGHSVVLKLSFGGFRILFGGDLNARAEQFLLAHYAGLEDFPSEGTQAYREMVAAASGVFRSDVMKVCHHGSEKVTDAFLECVDAAAFVISSGDEEGHVHPRPDLLGRLGSFGRGPAPVLLSTELQRSTRELEDEQIVARLKADIARLASQPTPELQASILSNVELLGRTNVAVWGTIYVKTDGQHLIAAFKKESRSETDKWFAFEYAFDASGLLELVR
jgi:beta-lactamase superfamily II metal-dependent hydrolase